jgi:hypothetical protein
MLSRTLIEARSEKYRFDIHVIDSVHQTGDVMRRRANFTHLGEDIVWE